MERRNDVIDLVIFVHNDFEIILLLIYVKIDIISYKLPIIHHPQNKNVDG